MNDRLDRWIRCPAGSALVGFILLWVVGPGASLRASAGGSYELFWFDEFDGISLNPEHWTLIEGPARDSVHHPDALSVGDGYLSIHTFTEQGTHYTGYLIGEGKLEARYGYWEARIRFADSPGMWSAFWLYAPALVDPAGQLKAASVEIDIAEHRAQNRLGWDRSGQIFHALHLGDDGSNSGRRMRLTGDLGIAEGWHTYGLESTPGRLRFYVDDRLTWIAYPALDRALHIRLTSEVEDGAWAGWIPAAGYGDRERSRTRMDVDYVRYYAPVEGPGVASIPYSGGRSISR